MHKTIDIQLKDMLNVLKRVGIIDSHSSDLKARSAMYLRQGNKKKRRKAYQRGLRAEWLAILLLRLKGYRILAYRLRTPVGEIDLVVQRGRRLAFVEVKQRESLEAAISAISSQQQQRIRRAAAYWLAQNNMAGFDQTGFDVILLSPLRLPQHLVDAFPPAT